MRKIEAGDVVRHFKRETCGANVLDIIIYPHAAGTAKT